METRTVDDLVTATGASRRTVLEVMRLYERLTGDTITRVARRNFLTPQLSPAQFEKLVQVITADDKLGYAERILAASGHELQAPSSQSASANATELLARFDSLQKLINEATEFTGQRVESLEQRITSLEQLVNQLIPFTHIVQGIPQQLAGLQQLVTQQSEQTKTQLQNFEKQMRDDMDILLQEQEAGQDDDDEDRGFEN